MYHEDKPLLRREVLSEEFLMSILDHQYYLIGTTCQYPSQGIYGQALMNMPITCAYCFLQITHGGSRLIGVCDGCLDKVLSEYTDHIKAEKEAIDQRWDAKGSGFRGCITCDNTSLTTTYYDLCPTGGCTCVVCRDCLTDNIRICKRSLTPLKCYVCKTKCKSYDDIPRAKDIETNIYKSRYTELVKYILHEPIHIEQYLENCTSSLTEYCGCYVLNKKTIGDYIANDDFTWRENSSFFIDTEEDKLEHNYCTSFCDHGDISVKFVTVAFKCLKYTYQQLINSLAVTSHSNFKLTYDSLFASCISRLEYRIKDQMENNDYNMEFISLINDHLNNANTSDIAQIDLSEIYVSDSEEY